MQKIDETITLTGNVHVQLLNSEGKLIYEHNKSNLVVTVGKNFLATWLTAATQSTPFMSYIALGTGTTAPTTADTALQSEFSGGGYSRVQGALTTPGSTNIWQNQATFPAGNGTGSVTEAGLFSASTSGTMFARNTFGAITKNSGDALIVTWQVTLG